MSGFRTIQRIAAPPDGQNRTVELAVAQRDGAFWWSLRVDAWGSVTASRWHPIESLEAFAAGVAARDRAFRMHDVAVSPQGDHFDVEVVVTSPSGAIGAAVDDARGLRHSALTLLDSVYSSSHRVPPADQ